MNVLDIIERIKKENSSLKGEIFNAEGLVRLQTIMKEYNGEYRLIWSDDIVKDLIDKPKPVGFKTGIEALDLLTGGFRQQQIVTLFAHTKHGKTEVGMWFTSLFPSLNPVFIAIEQNAEELISQRMERSFIIPRFLSPARIEAFVTTNWIEERVVEGIAKYNTKMVVIDHLGYIDNLGKEGVHKRENLAYRLGMVMKELKSIARKWDVLIILLVHVSEGDEGRPPSLQDIGNSSDIKKESDTVIGIWRKNTSKNKVRIYENKTMLSVLANRRFGKNGNVGLVFDDQKGIFYENNAWVEAMVRVAAQEVTNDEEYENL